MENKTEMNVEKIKERLPLRKEILLKSAYGIVKMESDNEKRKNKFKFKDRNKLVYFNIDAFEIAWSAVEMFFETYYGSVINYDNIPEMIRDMLFGKYSSSINVWIYYD